MHSSEMHESCMTIWEAGFLIGVLRLFTFTFDPETTGLTGGDVMNVIKEQSAAFKMPPPPLSFGGTPALWTCMQGAIFAFPVLLWLESKSGTVWFWLYSPFSIPRSRRLWHWSAQASTFPEISSMLHQVECLLYFYVPCECRWNGANMVQVLHHCNSTL